ncbi:Hypothetical protein, putative [Bodo saltans]|uniref:Uncharacterized protein n=1 Tax=Bodo saltans TaxID=75058 RepID=A0A0S4JD27_BODSA|nr:Hypothetical protein, putative [Bodo saltans]|eukprot:CUG86205.1 Hypothetical protein, putative [Bodo saltans]
MAAPHSTSSEDNSLRVLHKLLTAQHTRCEAHRLWARALEETLSGQLSMTTYGAKMNTLIAAMANTSAQFREVRDAVPTTDNAPRKTLPSVVKQWATGVQLLEKELYDATVTLQRISLTHAAARCETTTYSLSADVANSSSTATQDDDKIASSSSSSSPPPPQQQQRRGDNNVVKGSSDSPSPLVGYAPHCVDCSIAGLVASLHRGTAASSTAAPTSAPALLDDDKIPAPVIVGTWHTTDDRNQFLFPAGHDGESIDGSLQEGGNHPNDCDDDDDDDMQATRQPHHHHHHKTSAHNCRVASEECNKLRSVFLPKKKKRDEVRRNITQTK